VHRTHLFTVQRGNNFLMTALKPNCERMHGLGRGEPTIGEPGQLEVENFNMSIVTRSSVHFFDNTKFGWHQLRTHAQSTSFLYFNLKRTGRRRL
jgi:hypothetical protein